MLIPDGLRLRTSPFELTCHGLLAPAAKTSQQRRVRWLQAAIQRVHRDGGAFLTALFSRLSRLHPTTTRNFVDGGNLGLLSFGAMFDWVLFGGANLPLSPLLTLGVWILAILYRLDSQDSVLRYPEYLAMHLAEQACQLDQAGVQQTMLLVALGLALLGEALHLAIVAFYAPSFALGALAGVAIGAGVAESRRILDAVAIYAASWVGSRPTR